MLHDFLSSLTKNIHVGSSVLSIVIYIILRILFINATKKYQVFPERATPNLYFFALK